MNPHEKTKLVNLNELNNVFKDVRKVVLGYDKQLSVLKIKIKEYNKKYLSDPNKYKNGLSFYSGLYNKTKRSRTILIKFLSFVKTKYLDQLKTSTNSSPEYEVFVDDIERELKVVLDYDFEIFLPIYYHGSIQFLSITSRKRVLNVKTKELRYVNEWN